MWRWLVFRSNDASLGCRCTPFPVQLADFGHATRAMEPDAHAHPEVVTLWYRAPELLFRSPYHGPAVDMWAIGCILAAVLLRQHLFPGIRTDVDQLAHIFRLLGTPVDPGLPELPSDELLSEADVSSVAFGLRCESVCNAIGAAKSADDMAGDAMPGAADPFAGRQTSLVRHDPTWPGCSALPGFVQFDARRAQPWREIFPASVVSDHALDLLRGLLVYDPLRRLSAAEARRHPWFTVAPLPCSPAELPLPIDSRPLNSR